ncbi:carbohydrate-binding protein [Flavisolibacter nicotianae]|uniref:carbohydrate-binding protein n=1 Tax=Flavisolibacter nicotianae TaxID=2364882 RepID=UPI0013C45F6F|nr:carbohydrate-binding protein [Flavisolibacter nicotianae]
MKTILLGLCIIIFFNANATNYYFSSTTGDDSRSSAQAQNPATPWKSINKLNAVLSSVAPGDSILFKRGDVFYGTMSMSRSGLSGSPIVFAGYGSGANPIISGLTNMSGWRSVGNGLYQTTLSNPPTNQLMMVLFDGALQPLGRYPKAGKGRDSYFYISTPDPISSTTTINSNGIGSAPSFVGGELVQKKEQWVIDRSLITSQSSNTIVSTPYVSPDHPTTTYKSLYNHGFFFQNHVNACTQLGDWCYDNNSKTLTMNFGLNNPTDYSIQAATLDSLLFVNGQSNLTFSGLTFMGGNQHIVKFKDASYITIKNCDLSFSGANGVSIDKTGFIENTNHNTIANCNIHDINNNGLELAGSIYWTISGNYVHDIGMNSGMGLNGDSQYIGVFNVGSNSVVEYNKVENIGYSGIYFSGSNTIVRKNELKNYVAVKSDGGGIYTYENSGTNRLVEGNVCHDGVGDHYGINVDETNPFIGQVHGIYMDGNTANVTIRNNTCFNNSRSGIWLGSNASITVTGNTLYNNAVGQICAHDMKAVFTNMVVRNNILFAVTQEQLCMSAILRSNYYTSAFSMDSNFYCRPVFEVSGINSNGYPNSGSYVNYPDGGIIEAYDLRFYSLDTWQQLSGMDAHTQKTPVSISSPSDIRFEYNASNTSKTVSLDASYIDMKGQTYSGSLTLAPYSSIVMVKTSSQTLTQSLDYLPIPGKIEAESYYAVQGAVMESCSEGGKDASGFGQGSYLDYKVNVASAGTYTFNFRIAGWGGQFQVKNIAGTLLSTVNVPSTNGWQTWKTISSTVTLPAGQQILRFYVTSPGFNLNWAEALNNSTQMQSQVINFPAIANKQTTDLAFALSATASSGLPVIYNLVSGPASIAGSTVTLTGGTGTVTIEATQSGNGTYSAATPVRQSFSVNSISLLSQTISFPAIPSKQTTDPAFALSATTSSGLPVSYKVVSGPATISGSTVTLGGTAGTVTIEASQSGSTSYNAATPVTQSFSVSTSSTSSSVSTSGYQPIPGRVEAESYSAMQWVLLESCSEGGQDASGFGTGSWMDYKVNVAAAGTYTLNFRVAGWGGAMQLQNANGNTLASISVPSTGGWQVWKTISVSVNLPAGQQTLRLAVITGGFNFNWFEGVSSVAVQQAQTISFPAIPNKLTTDPAFTLSATATSGLAVSYRVVSGPATVSGSTVTLNGVAGTVTIEASQSGNTSYTAATPVSQSFTVTAPVVSASGYQPIPGKVEAESYSAMQWVLLESCSEGGLDAGGFGTGSWMDYKVNVASAGTYTLNFRVGGWGGSMQIRNAGGTVLNTVSVPSSGGWQTWKTVSATVNLAAGQQVLRLYVVDGGFTLNWFEGVTASASTTTTLPDYQPIPGKVESESYSAMQWVLQESCAEGGLDVGGFGTGSWMDYKINVAAAGAYTLNFRVAGWGGTMQLQNSSGSLTVSIPSTGGWQVWKTISVPVSLQAGPQVLRVYIVTGGFNLNWFEGLSSSSGTTVGGPAPKLGTTAGMDATTPSTTSSFKLYPVPVQSEMTLQLNNAYTGAVQVSVVDAAGRTHKEFSLQKQGQELIQRISVGGLTPGVYMLQVKMKDKMEAKSFVKQ